ncbi:MAG: hypothetical protein WD768_07565 [Phycisphaeraceae bacterium]
MAGRDVLLPSSNTYDWLGEGVYFWEHNADRALEFAAELRDNPSRAQRPIKTPAVIGAVIELGYCLNLLDSTYLRLVQRAYNDLAAGMESTGVPLPENRGGDDLLMRYLDNAVIQALHQSRKDAGLKEFDTVRAAFVEGPRLYPNAGFAGKNHIQICVRSPSCIKGYFRVLDAEGKPVIMTN